MNTNHTHNRLRLGRETLRELTAMDLRAVVGGTNDTNVATAGRRPAR